MIVAFVSHLFELEGAAVGYKVDCLLPWRTPPPPPYIITTSKTIRRGDLGGDGSRHIEGT